MTEKPVKNVAASVQQRLLNLCQSKGGDYNALLNQYAMERFLYRLSKSILADRFILKGAMLFRVWSDQLHRPTKDLDLLGFGEATPAAVTESIRTILATPVPEDGLQSRMRGPHVPVPWQTMAACRLPDVKFVLNLLFLVPGNSFIVSMQGFLDFLDIEIITNSVLIVVGEYFNVNSIATLLFYPFNSRYSLDRHREVNPLNSGKKN